MEAELSLPLLPSRFAACLMLTMRLVDPASIALYPMQYSGANRWSLNMSTHRTQRRSTPRLLCRESQ
jgi:hypothetical protein